MAPAVRSFSGELWHPAVQGAVGAGPDQSLGTLSFRCGSIRLRLVPERVDGYNMGVGVASPLRPVAARRSTPPGPRPDGGLRAPRAPLRKARERWTRSGRRWQAARALYRPAPARSLFNASNVSGASYVATSSARPQAGAIERIMQVRLERVGHFLAVRHRFGLRPQSDPFATVDAVPARKLLSA